MVANTQKLNILDGTGAPQYLSQIINLEDAATINRVTLYDATPTFTAHVLGLTPVATPTDIVVIQGSATKTIRLKRITFSGVATAQGNMPVQLVRRSTAGTQGSAVLTALTKMPRDAANDSTATVTISTVGTANYTTLGTLVGLHAVGRIQFGVTATGLAGDGAKLSFEFCHWGDKPVILNGVTDFVCINLNGTAVPSGGVIDINVLWSETSST